MRLVRLGSTPARVGADVRAALTSWGAADTVLGGIALLGATPIGCPRPVEAVVLMPRGVLIVVGVDLPDPAMRLDAPLNGTWKADGWPLVRPDGAVNPAGEALATAGMVTQLIQRGRAEPLPVGTVVAVGPYVSQVVSPTVDLHRGVRVLHPQSKNLLAAARELSTHHQQCTVDQARELLTALVGHRVRPTVAELTAEGFRDVVAKEVASAQTLLLPKVTDAPAPKPKVKAAAAPGREPARIRWLPISALALLAVLLITGITVAVSSSSDRAPAAAVLSTGASPSRAPDVTVAGQRFAPQGAQQTVDCATHAYGDVQVWLTAHPCTALSRALYGTTVAGKRVAIALAVVNFANASTAQTFTAEATTAGSGGITDLIADGESWSGGPSSFNNAAYAVVQQGTAVRLTEAVWIGAATSPTDPTLTALVTKDGPALPATP